MNELIENDYWPGQKPCCEKKYCQEKSINSTNGNVMIFINQQCKLDDKGCRGCGGDRYGRPMDYLCRPRGDN